MTSTSQRAYLIVNADDYGYFPNVSRGILKSAAEGIVTATGVLSNTHCFVEHAAWLRDHDTLDVGVHLNLTTQRPLSMDMTKKFSSRGGEFPGKFSIFRALMSGMITLDNIRTEWAAQVERSLASGLRPKFLNSHEHIHMLPPLLSLTRDLARQYAIPHVRFSTTELGEWSLRGSAIIRGTIIKGLEIMNRRDKNFPTPDFLGIGQSGSLNLSYLKNKISRLRPGNIYELMCHPGHRNDQHIIDPRIARYHDWEGELNTLTNPVTKDLLLEHGIQLIGYRHLHIEQGRLVVRELHANCTPIQY